MAVQTEKWQHQWSLSDKGRYCYSILPNVKTIPWYQNTPFSRKNIVFWNRIIANHNTSYASLNRFNIVNNPLCICGNYDTIDHIFFECSNTIDTVLNDKLLKMGHIKPLNIRNIIAKEIEDNRYDGMLLLTKVFEDILN